MSVQSYQSRVDSLQKEINRLNKQASDEAAKEAQLQGKIVQAQDSISRTSNTSTIRTKLRQIERWNKQLVKIGSKKAGIAKKLSQKSNELTRARANLLKAQQQQARNEVRKQQAKDRRLQDEITRVGMTAEALQRELTVIDDSQKTLSHVFVLESDLSQGTCFVLEGVGLVTCAHVLSDDMKIFRPTNVTKQFPITVVKSSRVIDLAVISSEAFETADGLKCGTSDGLQIGDRVLLAGYPNFRKGDTGIVVAGHITGFRTVSAIRRILVSVPIVAGNSGGPVLNRNGEVIGVAATGADRMEEAGETEDHGVVPIDALEFIL